jgi:hypothetical protein
MIAPVALAWRGPGGANATHGSHFGSSGGDIGPVQLDAAQQCQ